MIDRVFKAYDIRGAYPNPLSEDVAWKIGYATATYLKRSRQNLRVNQRVRLENTIVVGRDMRPSSPALAGALIDGIAASGTDVIDVGMVDSAFIYFAINHLDCLAGIQTTASHNPPADNGFKVSGPKARPIGAGSGLDEIKRIVATLRTGATGLKGACQQIDLWPDYRQHVLKSLQLKRPLTVVVDASNGMAGRMAPQVFGGVDGLTVVPLLFQTDGSFVHPPNPLVESNLRLLKEKMERVKPDLGVCFDGDADRCVFLDEQARTIGCDLITALLARDYLSVPQNKGATVVYDLRSSHVVPDVVRENGGVPRRERVGHAFIKSTMLQSNAVFGGEVSGHFYFRENFFTDSGAIALARVASVLSQSSGTFSQLIGPFDRYARTGELNFRVEDKEGAMRSLAENHKRLPIDYLDGITVDGGSWWFNVRKSNTEPFLRLNLEAQDPQILATCLANLKRILGEPIDGH
jgi:phosphomannomutase